MLATTPVSLKKKLRIGKKMALPDGTTHWSRTAAPPQVSARKKTLPDWP
jgi:hypothetical protein